MSPTGRANVLLQEQRFEGRDLKLQPYEQPCGSSMGWNQRHGNGFATNTKIQAFLAMSVPGPTDQFCHVLDRKLFSYRDCRTWQRMTLGSGGDHSWQLKLELPMNCSLPTHRQSVQEIANASPSII